MRPSSGSQGLEVFWGIPLNSQQYLRPSNLNHSPICLFLSLILSHNTPCLQKDINLQSEHRAWCTQTIGMPLHQCYKHAAGRGSLPSFKSERGAQSLCKHTCHTEASGKASQASMSLLSWLAWKDLPHPSVCYRYSPNGCL